MTAWLVWPMLISATLSSWWGTRELLAIAASQAGATGGEAWQESLVTVTHIFGGLSLIASWSLLIVGFARSGASAQG